MKKKSISILIPITLVTLFVTLFLATLHQPAAASIPPESPETPLIQAAAITYTTFIYANHRTDSVINQSYQAVFGPHICTAYGDPFSPFNSSHRPPGHPPGPFTYHYAIRIPDTYPHDIVRVELFDPDSHNAPDNTDTIVRSAFATNPPPPASPLPPTTTGTCPGAAGNRKNPCLLDTGEMIFVNNPPYVTIDDINPFWFMRVDENRGTGGAPGDGTCGQPVNYDPNYNTQTLYTLSYLVPDGSGGPQEVPLAYYTGRLDNLHDTDLRWVSPGSPMSYDQAIPVPIDPGSPQSDFEIDLTTETPDIVTDPTTGDRYLYLGVTAIYGSSENGFDIWAGPPTYINTSPSDVNARNIDVLNNPGSHSAQGVTIFALDYAPKNSNISFRERMPLTYIGPEYAGQTIYVSLFDSDAGADVPVTFYFDTIAQTDWEKPFGIGAYPGGTDPDGVPSSARCIPPNCNDQFIDPPYGITIPGDLENCDWQNPDPDACTPFYGGRLMVSYDGGEADTYAWSVQVPEAPAGDPTVGCAAFPFAIHEHVRSVTPPGTGSNPFPEPGDYHPSSPMPVYTDFPQHVPDVALQDAQEGYIYKIPNGSGPGSYSWLVWNTGIANTATTLNNSLAWPGNTLDYIDHGDSGVPATPDYPWVVRGYVEPFDTTDTTLHIGDWLATVPGTTISSIIRTTFNDHITAQRTLRVPIWDQSQSPGGSTALHTQRFALFRPQGHNLSATAGQWMLAEFIGWDDSCGQPASDLAVGQPRLITQPPIPAYTPVKFGIPITNTSTTAVNDLFFVDLYFDPTPILSTTIPLTQSVGYTAVPALAGQTSTIVTITVPLGFTYAGKRDVYAVVDSVEQIVEANEYNNISVPLTVTVGPPTGTLEMVAIYALAYDNEPNSPKNLTPYYQPTIEALVDGSVGTPEKTAVVLADLDDAGDTHILVIQDGITTTISGLPDSSGILTPGLTEYDMSDGATLGGFLLWARQQYPAGKTTFSFIGHGAPLAPKTDLGAIFTDTLPLGESPYFPSHLGANADFTDYHSLSIISPPDLALALDRATNGGQNPLDVLDLVHCFALTIEEAYELAPYSRTMTGTPNYAYYDATMPGKALKNLDLAMSPAQMADTMLQTYDTVLPHLMHPRILLSLDSSQLTAVKDAWDITAYHLLQSFAQDAVDTKDNLTDAYLNSAKYDTSFCEINWDLTAPDALSDMADFAQQLVTTFGPASAVGQWAAITAQRIETAVLSTYIQNGIPWFDQDPPLTVWNFTGAGLALYTDFQMVDIEGDSFLNWQAYWYTDTVRPDNLQPYAFVQDGYEGATWADVFVRFWQGTTIGSAVCVPAFPPVGNPGELSITGITLNQIEVMMNMPVTISATISTAQTAVNPSVQFHVYQDGERVYHDLIGAGYLVTGTHLVTATLPWTPAATGVFTVEVTVDVDGRFWETNEDNNTATHTDTVLPNPTTIYLPLIQLTKP